VIKALELKKKYAPLTPKQQEIYDNRFEEEEEEEYLENNNSYLKEAQMQALAERAEAQQEAIKSELAADISHAAQMERAKEEISQKAQAAQKAVEETAAQSEKVLADKAEEIAAEAGLAAESTEEAAPEEQAVESFAAEAQQEETRSELAADISHVGQMERAKEEIFQAEQKAAEETAARPEKVIADKAEETAAGVETQQEEIRSEFSADISHEGQMESAEEILPEEPAEESFVKETPGRSDAVPEPEEVPQAEEEPEEELTEEQMQEDMVRSMREIVSGSAPERALTKRRLLLTRQSSSPRRIRKMRSRPEARSARSASRSPRHPRAGQPAG